MPRKPDLSLIGQTYNNLKVDSLTGERNTYNRQLYKCTCLLCGETRLATKANLQRGEIKDCGYHRQYLDIKNKRFGKLIALYATDKRSKSKNKCKIWHCKCDCGNECEAHYNNLIDGTVRSCGCLKSDNLKSLFFDGTEPCKLDGSKLRNTNKSGTTGVWFDKTRNKWCAEIMFKRKKYFLGRYNDKDDAIAVRKEAEKEIFGSFLEWYETNRDKLINKK